MLARVGAAEGLAVLVFAVDGFHHQLAQLAAGVARQERIPVTAPDGLDHVPAGATEVAFQLLDDRSEEHTSELQSLMRISYAVFCLKKKTTTNQNLTRIHMNSHTIHY